MHRAGGGMKRVATITAFGIHHANALVRELVSQSRELWTTPFAIRLSGTARTGASLTRTLGLDRRARNRAIGTEHATIARLRPQCRAAAGAGIEKPAGIGRHGLRFRGGAMRAGDDRFKNHSSS